MIKVGRCGRQRGHDVVSQVRHSCILRGDVWQVVDAILRMLVVNRLVECLGVIEVDARCQGSGAKEWLIGSGDAKSVSVPGTGLSGYPK